MQKQKKDSWFFFIQTNGKKNMAMENSAELTQVERVKNQ